MTPELIAQVPALALIVLVFYLVFSLRRERRRHTDLPADLADTVEALLKRMDQLTVRVDEVTEQALRLDERLADALDTANHNHDRIAKHRTALERFGVFLEDELNRIDRGLADVQARVNALTLPESLQHGPEEELAEYEIAYADTAS